SRRRSSSVFAMRRSETRMRPARRLRKPRMMLKKARSLALIAGWLLASCTSLPDMSKEHLAAARQAREKGELEPALRALTDAVNSASELSFFFTEALLERGDLYLELWESRTGVSETER